MFLLSKAYLAAAIVCDRVDGSVLSAEHAPLRAILAERMPVTASLAVRVEGRTAGLHPPAGHLLEAFAHNADGRVAWRTAPTRFACGEANITLQVELPLRAYGDYELVRIDDRIVTTLPLAIGALPAA